MRALLSVYDKTGLVDLARGLAGLGLGARGQRQDGRRAEPTPASPSPRWPRSPASPEMLGGRVKTLHPKVHGGILADRVRTRPPAPTSRRRGSSPSTWWCATSTRSAPTPPSSSSTSGVPPWCGPRPRTTPTSAWCRPRRLRRRCSRSCAPRGRCRDDTRRRLARAAFAHTAAYDAAIVAWFDAGGAGGAAELLPPTIHVALERRRRAALRREPPPARGPLPPGRARPRWWDGVVQHAGTALSYLNIFDADAAWRLVGELAGAGGEAAVAIIKHANPCGAALAADPGRRLPPGARVRPRVRLRRRRGPGRAGAPRAVARTVAEGPQADVIVAAAFDAERARRSSWPGARPPACSRRPPHRAGERSSCAASGAGSSSRSADRLVAGALGLAGAHQGGPTDDAVARHRAGVAGVRPDVVQRHRRGRPTARPSGWGRASRAGWRRPRSPCARPAAGPGAARPPATPSSPSATGSTSLAAAGRGGGGAAGGVGERRRGRGRRRRARHRHGAHRRAPLPALRRHGRPPPRRRGAGGADPRRDHRPRRPPGGRGHASRARAPSWWATTRPARATWR